MSNKAADQLLKWGIENAPVNPDGTSSVAQVSRDVEEGRRPDLTDPGLYDAIMGKSEAQMMQEELSVAVDGARSVDDRCTALDNFEMLIEQVDNANNMEPLRMWPAVLSLLDASQDVRVRTADAWVVGTAVQNNDKAQAVAFAHGALDRIVGLFGDLSCEALVNKAVYALSAMLRHYPAAVQAFSDKNGWGGLHTLLHMPSVGVRRKVAFLLNQLILQAGEAAERPSSGAVAPRPEATADMHMPVPPTETGPATLQSGVTTYPPVAQLIVDHGIADALVDSIISDGDVARCGNAYVREDADYVEKAVQALETLVSQKACPPNVPRAKLESLVQFLSAPGSDGEVRSKALDLDLAPLTAYLTRT